jgi:hypothetical protein
MPFVDDGFLQIGQRTKEAVAADMASEPLPQAFDGVQFRRVGREEEQLDPIRNSQVFGLVPARAVEDQKKVLIGVLLMQMGKIKAHHLRIHGRELERELLSTLGMDCGEEIEVLVPGLYLGDGPLSPQAPRAPGTGFQPKPPLIKEPDLSACAVLLSQDPESRAEFF